MAKYNKTPEQREKENERIRQVIELYNEGQNAIDIASKIGLSAPTVRKYIRQSEGKLHGSVISEIDIEDKYDFEEDNIVFYRNKTDIHGEKVREKISIPINEVAELSFKYTKLGESKTIAKLTRDLGIKPDILRLVFRRLDIGKESNILPDAVLDRIEQLYGEEAVEKRIIEVTHKAHHNKYTNKFIEAYEKKTDRLDDKMRMVFSSQENYLKNLGKYLEKYIPKHGTLKELKLKNNNEKTVVISDLHIGKGGTQYILDRLNKIATNCVNSPQDTINVICLGDLVENISPIAMHHGQAEHMEMNGFDLILYTVEAIQNFLVKIAKKKKVTFNGIVGNHDRMASGNDQDHERLGGLVIYELVKRGLDNTPIEVNYLRDKWNSFILGGFGFIINHGDVGATNKKSSDIIMNFGKVAEHTIVLMGDKHHLEMKDESDGVIRVIAPALAGRGEYDTRLGLSSYSGFIEIEKGWDGLPQTNIIRLK